MVRHNAGSSPVVVYVSLVAHRHMWLQKGVCSQAHSLARHLAFLHMLVSLQVLYQVNG